MEVSWYILIDMGGIIYRTNSRGKVGSTYTKRFLGSVNEDNITIYDPTTIYLLGNDLPRVERALESIVKSLSFCYMHFYPSIVEQGTTFMRRVVYEKIARELEFRDSPKILKLDIEGGLLN